MKDLSVEMAEQERKAWDSLARYKFWMFGYHAANWVNINRLAGFKAKNPFRDLIKVALQKRGDLPKDGE